MAGKRGAVLITVLAALAASSARADHVHGIVTSLDGQMLTIKNDNAKSVIVQLDPNARIVHNRRFALTDIQPGAFVGTFAVITRDKTLRAQGVRVFPDAMRGVGEGQYPMASNADRIMTYGTVAGVTPQPSGGVLKLTFHGAGPSGDAACTGHAPAGGAGCEGSADIFVARGVPVMSIESGDASLLLPGTVVAADTTIDAGGLSTATIVTIEREAPVPKD
ncbi:MAG TPA: hypothetical protein VGU69_03320 [Rhizomicrobium sp.]|nr:hypothetical protein [Rhizomicrobium sp.]